MKKYIYICDKCGETMPNDRVYTISIEKLDETEVHKTVSASKVKETIAKAVQGKHICENCLSALIKGLSCQNSVVDKSSVNEETREISESELRKLLIDDKMTIQAIADKTNNTYKHVWYLAHKKYEILEVKKQQKQKQ